MNCAFTDNIYIYTYTPKVNISKYMREMRTILAVFIFILNRYPENMIWVTALLLHYSLYVVGIISYAFSSALLLLFEYR